MGLLVILVSCNYDVSIARDTEPGRQRRARKVEEGQKAPKSQTRQSCSSRVLPCGDNEWMRMI